MTRFNWLWSDPPRPSWQEEYPHVAGSAGRFFDRVISTLGAGYARPGPCGTRRDRLRVSGPLETDVALIPEYRPLRVEIDGADVPYGAGRPGEPTGAATYAHGVLKDRIQSCRDFLCFRLGDRDLQGIAGVGRPMVLNGEDDRAIRRWRDPRSDADTAPRRSPVAVPRVVSGVMKFVMTDPPTGVQCGCACGDCAAAAEPARQSDAAMAARTSTPCMRSRRVLSLIPPSLS